MKWARIENKKVMEIIDFNPKGRFTPEIVNQFVECNDNVEQHDVYEDGEFIRHEVIEEQMQQKSLIETLTEENENLKNQLAQMNTDMQSFMDYMFTVLP